MNILLLSTSDKGGAANACVRLHQGLLAIGESSKMLVLKRTRAEEPEIHRFLTVYEPTSLFKKIKKAPRVIAFNRKRAKQTAERPTNEMFSFFDTLHDITQHPLYEWADVINIHWVANFLDYPSFFSKNTKPVVWTLHDMLLFTGGNHYEKNFPFAAYQDLIQSNLTLKKKAFAKQDFTIVCPSNWLHQAAKAQQDLYPKAQHRLIPYGLQTEAFVPQDQAAARALFDIPVAQKIILFVAASADSLRKGINHLIDALPYLKNQNIGIAIMGSNVEKLNIDFPNIYPLGYINDIHKIAAAYAAADLFVIPSIEDNLPNTVIESLCCGTPVVGFDIGGIPDMVIPGKNGEICPTIAGKALAETLQTALQTAYDTTWIRSNALERYGLEVQAHKYKELFEELIK